MNAETTLLIADDNRADRTLTLRAFRQIGVTAPIRELADGEELLDYLHAHGSAALPDPMVILLDINMPRKTGLEALSEIRASPELRHIPVVMLTTSDAEGDVAEAYLRGANSFITKPVDFSSFLALVGQLKAYWLDMVALSRRAVAAASS